MSLFFGAVAKWNELEADITVRIGPDAEPLASRVEDSRLGDGSVDHFVYTCMLSSVLRSLTVQRVECWD